MFCKFCGNEVDSAARFCQRCGAALSDVAEPVRDAVERRAEMHPAHAAAKPKKKKKISVKCRKHPMAYVIDFIVMAMFVALGMYILSISKENDDKIMNAVGMAVIIYGALSFILSFLRNITEYIAITPEGVTGKKGLLFSDLLKSPVGRIQDVGIRNGPLGKIFNYSTISVATAGTGGKEFMFTDMRHGKEFQEAFIALAEKED